MAEIPLAHNRSGREKQKTYVNHIFHAGKYASKRLCRQRGRIIALLSRSRNQHGKSGHAAYKQGIHKHLHNPVKSLARRVVYLGRGVKNRRGSLPRLIGVQPPGHAVAHSLPDCQSGQGAAPGFQRKCPSKNRGEHGRNLPRMKQQHQQPAQKIEPRHKRRDVLCHLDKALETAADNQAHQHCQEDARRQGRDMKGFLGHLGNGVGLDQGSPAVLNKEQCRHQGPHTLPVQAIGNIVHRASRNISLPVPSVVANAQGNLPELCCHPEKRSCPHPEQRSGTAGEDRGGYPHNIPASHAAGNGRAERLVGRAFFFVLCLLPAPSEHPFGDEEKAAQLDKAGHSRIINAQAHQGKKEPVSPEKVR